MKNFTEKLSQKIEEAQEKVAKVQEKALEKLLDNDKFIEVQREIIAKENEISNLHTTIIQLNSITPFITNDGRKFSVRVYPIAAFGTGLGQVLGIINGSKSAFVDEKLMEYAAISGVSQLELVEAALAMGNPTYYANGIVNDATPGNYTKLVLLLDSIFIKLGLHEFKAKDFTKSKYDLWFAKSEISAMKKFTESEKLQDMEEEITDFTLES